MEKPNIPDELPSVSGVNEFFSIRKEPRGMPKYPVEEDGTDEVELEVICSFDRLRQVRMNVVFHKDKSEITKERIIARIRRGLTLEECAELRKMSCCQLYTAREEDLLPCLMDCEGKFFFDDNGSLIPSSPQ
jgi:hypothetical protein